MTETLTRDLAGLAQALRDEADKCERFDIAKPAYLMREAAAVIHVGCSATMDMFTEGKPALEQLAMAAGMVSALNQGSGSCVYSVCSPPCAGVSQEHLERFAGLVRADERRKCIDLCIDQRLTYEIGTNSELAYGQGVDGCIAALGGPAETYGLGGLTSKLRPRRQASRLERPVGRLVENREGLSMLKAWDEEAPPRQTWVAARYGVMEPDHIVKTCKHGCCVIDPLCGSMVLPKFWRLATDDEVRSVLPRPKTPNVRANRETTR